MAPKSSTDSYKPFVPSPCSPAEVEKSGVIDVSKFISLFNAFNIFNVLVDSELLGISPPDVPPPPEVTLDTSLYPLGTIKLPPFS